MRRIVSKALCLWFTAFLLFLPVAFSAGGIAACFGMDLDCVETKCEAMGDPFCEIFIGPPKMVEEKKKALWKKWKLI